MLIVGRGTIARSRTGERTLHPARERGKKKIRRHALGGMGRCSDLPVPALPSVLVTERHPRRRTAACRGQSIRWSFTMPTACIIA